MDRMGSTTRTIIVITPKVTGGVGVLAQYFEKALQELDIKYRKIEIWGTACLDRVLASTVIPHILHKLDKNITIITLSNAIPPVKILEKVRLWITYIHCPEPLARYRLSKIMYYIFRKRQRKITSSNLIFLVNSEFTKKLVEKYWEIYTDKFYVLHPCINESIICKNVDNITKHPLLVTTVARIHPTKNLDIVLNVADVLREFKFIIMGVVQDFSYYKQLIDIIKIRKLSNVCIMPNVPKNVKFRLLTVSSYYLHPTLWENFGIAVVEAIACGAIPIVHRFSGAFLDVLERGKYGFGFVTPSDIVHILSRKPMIDRSLLVDRARKFTYDTFKEELGKILQELEIL